MKEGDGMEALIWVLFPYSGSYGITKRNPFKEKELGSGELECGGHPI